MHTIPPPPLHKSPTRGVERVETCGAQEVGWALGGGALDIQLHLPPWELLGLGTRWSDIWGHRAGFDGTLQPVASNDKLCNSFDKMSVAIQIVVPLQITDLKQQCDETNKSDQDQLWDLFWTIVYLLRFVVYVMLYSQMHVKALWLLWFHFWSLDLMHFFFSVDIVFRIYFFKSKDILECKMINEDFEHKVGCIWWEWKLIVVER